MTAGPQAADSSWSRADLVLKAHRLALTGGSDALLRWLAARTGAWTGLIAADGSVLRAAPAGPDPGAAGLLARGAVEMSARGVRSAMLDGGGSTAVLFALDEPAGAAAAPLRALAAVAPRPLPDRLPALLADAAVPLALALRAEEADLRHQQAARAESRAREAVLHLLMNGRLSTAHQIAGALTPALPDPMRLYVVECPPGERAAVARTCAGLTGGRAWVVPCPVYVRHLIVFVPAGPAGPDDGRDPLAEALTAATPAGVVGVSEAVPLREAPDAYRQAFHALAVARGRDARHARFGAGPELALAAHGPGAAWAAALLAPLHTYRPRRPQDPGAQELRATTHAWLNFASHATRLLKVHRNTLAGRLRHVEGLLGVDLAALADQSALSLALRLTPGGAGEPADLPVAGSAVPPGAGAGAGADPRTFDEVLAHPAVVRWAGRQLRPLADEDAPPGARDTLRTWLEHDAQLVPTAAALGLSVPGARKRLTRLEAVLERSLLQSPSARHDLWIAHRSVELVCHNGTKGVNAPIMPQ
ncbi:helix-turn-helix domain-containing protein [Streptomyces bambusae]|uniref:helix-turn-helix domain-containing protein n=1 Tax=Streptomyces bambusae TaxID=1550616 RepID=UPI001CFE6846|nr:helix-turn-helix domain-containing protein [Streptomyces bambusae]MCB5164334.1 helix-turn-helix domain-containing protein [Streptomyces bambusae]